MYLFSFFFSLIFAVTNNNKPTNLPVDKADKLHNAAVRNDEFVTMLSLSPTFEQLVRQNAGILSKPRVRFLVCASAMIAGNLLI